jgi:hypothetical protein
LDGYDFVDCLLLDFALDPHLRHAEMACETYFKLRVDGARQRGVLRIRLDGLRALTVKVHPEFHVELDRPYRAGNTMKANEVITFSLTRAVEGSPLSLRLASDMLSAVAECERGSVAEEVLE